MNLSVKFVVIFLEMIELNIIYSNWQMKFLLLLIYGFKYIGYINVLSWLLSLSTFRISKNQGNIYFIPKKETFNQISTYWNKNILQFKKMIK